MSTIGRPEALQRFLTSLEQQNQSYFVTLVEQSTERSCEPLLAGLVAAGNAEYIHEPAVRGLSRGRNRGLETVRGLYVAFPDDDCWYPEDVLSEIAAHLAFAAPAIDGLSVILTAPEGKANLLRWLDVPADITPQLIPRTVTSATLFLSAAVVEAVGGFDVELGSGSGTKFGAGEETDFVLRALAAGARLRYTPECAVFHAEWRDEGPVDAIRAKVRRYNRGFGRVLRKHDRRGEFLYWSGRSLAGVVISSARLDRRGAQHQFDQLVGRVQGWSARR
ncbi:glycosyltransferase family 2 protein [Plantibacter sp. YIM 135347]|uniref:glycosyltransferase family 2 protein n=1 Tax=Plantibacter sp. YIM 135347 TaxID=3423919 RepID=UPI003D331662